MPDNLLAIFSWIIKGFDMEKTVIIKDQDFSNAVQKIAR
jgi:hypothetical protein